MRTSGIKHFVECLFPFALAPVIKKTSDNGYQGGADNASITAEPLCRNFHAQTRILSFHKTGWQSFTTFGMHNLRDFNVSFFLDI